MSIDKRIIQYLKEEICKENKTILFNFRQNVTMDYKELKEFLNSDKFLRSPFNETGDIPDINRAVLRISNKQDDDLTETDYDWMRIVNSSIEKIKNSDKQDRDFRMKSLGFKQD